MKIVGDDLIEDFIKRYPKAAKSMEAWRKTIENNAFRHFVDLKGMIRSADYVKPYTIFDISKNKYRLIAQISYNFQEVLIKSIMSHKEYSIGKWRRENDR